MPRRSQLAEIVAHRGASIAAPENTLAAVNLAWEWDADAVEVDVHLTRDGRVVVIHDESLLRTCEVDVLVRELSLADLQRFDVGSWRGLQWAGERVPTLADVIATIPNGRRLFVELKCSAEALDSLAGDLAAVRDRPQSVVLIGFDAELMTAAKRRFPNHLAYLIVEQICQPDGTFLPTIETISEECRRAGLDGADLSNTLAVTADAIQTLKAASLATCVWTVNSPADARRLIGAGIDSITTDNPRLLQDTVF